MQMYSTSSTIAYELSLSKVHLQTWIKKTCREEMACGDYDNSDLNMEIWTTYCGGKEAGLYHVPADPK